MDEGCLSIPDIIDKVSRPEKIFIEYYDSNLIKRTTEFSGWTSRVIQHEYDHLQNKLFIDYLSAFRRRMHKSDLKEIAVDNEKPLSNSFKRIIISQMNIVFMGCQFRNPKFGKTLSFKPYNNRCGN